MPENKDRGDWISRYVASLGGSGTQNDLSFWDSLKRKPVSLEVPVKIQYTPIPFSEDAQRFVTALAQRIMTYLPAEKVTMFDATVGDILVWSRGFLEDSYRGFIVDNPEAKTRNMVRPDQFLDYAIARAEKMEKEEEEVARRNGCTLANGPGTANYERLVKIKEQMDDLNLR